jgi:hypothetical protein
LSGLDCELVDACVPALCRDLALLLHFDRDATRGETDTLAHDFSGNGNDASCDGAACPVPDPLGYQLRDGAHFRVPSSPSLDAPSSVTLSVRFRPNVFTADFSPIVTKFDDAPFSANYRLAENGGQLWVNFFPAGATDWLNHGTSRTFAPDTFYHLVGIIENATRRVRLYVNAELVIDTVATAEMTTDDGDVWIGWAPTEPGVNGIIDDVAIWTRALDEAEIDVLY